MAWVRPIVFPRRRLNHTGFHSQRKGRDPVVISKGLIGLFPLRRMGIAYPISHPVGEYLHTRWFDFPFRCDHGLGVEENMPYDTVGSLAESDCLSHGGLAGEPFIEVSSGTGWAGP